jgi:hypothetical protein
MMRVGWLGLRVVWGQEIGKNGEFLSEIVGRHGLYLRKSTDRHSSLI